MKTLETLQQEEATARQEYVAAVEAGRELLSNLNQTITEFLKQNANPMNVEFEVICDTGYSISKLYVDVLVRFLEEDETRIEKGYKYNFGSNFNLNIYDGNLSINNGTIGTYDKSYKFQIARVRMIAAIWEHMDEIIGLVDFNAMRKINDTTFTAECKMNKITDQIKDLERYSKMVKVSLTQAQHDLVSALIGQMSDGYWENNPAYEKYWRNLHLEDNELYIDTLQMTRMCWSKEFEKECENVWLSSNPDNIKDWLAKKAQIVLNADLRDNQQWDSSKCNAQTYIAKVCGDLQANYMDRGVNQTYEEIQEAIDSMKF